MITYDELAEELARQQERADNAETRLDLARQALVSDGYFTRAEVGEWDQPDIAPRITELTVHLRDRIEATLPTGHSAVCRQPAYDAVFTFIRSLASSDISRNAVIWRAVTAALDAAKVTDCQAAGHDSTVHGSDTGPNTEYRDFSRIADGELRWIATDLLDDADSRIDLSRILCDYQRDFAPPFGFTATADIPPALRGPDWPEPTEGTAPLRKLAEQALADGGPLPGVRPYSEVKVDMDRVAEELAGPESPGLEGLYDQIMAVYGVPLPPYKPRPQNACPCGGGDIGGQRIHDPHCPMHPARIRAVEALLDAQLPEQARVEGIHFEIEPEGEAQ